MNNIKYSVCEYFDDHLEKVIKSGLTFEEAKRLKYSFTPGCYTSYEVRGEIHITKGEK